MSINGDLKEIIFTEEQIVRRVKELGAQISQDYEGGTPLLVGVLKGCFIFLADLVRSIGIDCEIRFIAASSYGLSSVSSGSVKFEREFDFQVAGRDVIIIEDILDSGVTLSALREHIIDLGPASLKICAMFDKTARRKIRIDADYLGFECPDEFLVGYGLDYAERYRHLPYIASLKPEIYVKKR